MHGAMLITAGALISRLLGVLYRPGAQQFIGDAGLDLVTPPSAAYQVMFAISAVGLNVAISRLIAERLVVEDYRGARRVLRVATGLLLVSGTVFSILFALGARWMATVSGYPESWTGFIALAPAIFLVTLLSVFRGLFQGMQHMRPAATSQVVEQAARVGLGLVMVALLAPVDLGFGAAAFNAGNTVGILLGVIYSAWVYFTQRPTAHWNTVAPGVESYEHEPVRKLVERILAIALPLSLLGAVLPLMGLVDSFLVKNRLVAAGLDGDAALAWLANAGQLRDLPSILTTALYVSLVPAITESIAARRWDQVRYRSAAAFRLTFLIGIPATAGLLIGAESAYKIIYEGPGYVVMGPLAWSTLFLMVQQTSAGILQGMGLIWLSVRNMLLGVAAKLILTYWWTGIPALHAAGAAYATDVAFAVAAGLNLLVLQRRVGLAFRLKEDILQPLLASSVMGLVIWLMAPAVHAAVAYERLAGAIVVGTGALVYLVAIFGLGGVSEADLRLIPGVKPGLIAALRRYRLVRD